MAEKFIYSSIFGDLTRNVQARFDAVSLYHKQLYDNVIFENYLDWDTPTIGLTFEELIGSYNVSIAAPTIGDSSKEAIISPEGLKTFSEKVLNHAITRPMRIEDYRKVLQILDSKALPDATKKQQLIDLMWGTVQTPVQGVLAKLDMIFLGSLFNEGKFTFDNTTNPEGGVQGTIDFGQPTENIATVNTSWGDGNLSTVDCFEDIQSMIDAFQDKVVFSKILLAPSLLSYICRATNTRKMIWGTDKSARNVTIADLNLYMQSNGFPIFEVMRRQVRIQNGGTVTIYSPINAHNLVFVPDGKLGVVKNAYANSELKEEPGVAYSNYGRVRVSQWGVGESQGSNGVEFTKAECLALPIITEFEGIGTLKTVTE